MLKIIDTPLFWACIVLGIFATGVFRIIPAADLDRATAQLIRIAAQYL